MVASVLYHAVAGGGTTTCIDCSVAFPSVGSTSDNGCLAVVAKILLLVVHVHSGCRSLDGCALSVDPGNNARLGRGATVLLAIAP